jgi:hypothetical protein
MPWLSSVKGVIEAWYPGQDDGTAIASVLFGDTDPSGHLPETFPTSLTKMPTASPAQFPGVAGKVDYSEGLDVGYRWYDAKHVTPLFPFGYGLSYTTFGFSHLTVTPGSVVNRTSGPDSPKGQGAKVAEVTAVITNTGSVSGSDVAQLYIGDPAVAGEPPRQLEGFQRVTLQPHRSRTITFTLTGHELSYFSTAADGWTLPGGRFSVYVGDSSALSSLPLHGTLNVTSTIGARYARLTAPATVNAGAAFTAKAQFVNQGSVPITDATVALTVPTGWTSAPVGAESTISLAPGQSVTRSFDVTPPESAEGEVDSLTARLTSPGTAGSGDLSASATVTVPGPITVSARSPAVVTAGGSSLVAVSVTSHMSQAVVVDLAPSLPVGVTISPAAPSVTVPANSTVELGMSISVAAGTSPRSDRVPLGPSFSYEGAQYPLAATGLTVDVPYPSFSAAYDSTSISSDGDVGAADFDGNGDSYSEQALTAAGLAPGASVAADGTTLTWPDVPAGTPDSVQARGQTILMPASPPATQLTFLGASSLNGEPGTLTSDYSGTGTIEYTDGTTRSYQLTFDNWFAQPNTPSNMTVATPAYVNDSTRASNRGVAGRRNHEAHVFAVSIQVDPDKTVSSVTLPTVATLPGVYPVRVFALALGGGGAAAGAGGTGGSGVGSAGG